MLFVDFVVEREKERFGTGTVTETLKRRTSFSFAFFATLFFLVRFLLGVPEESLFGVKGIYERTRSMLYQFSAFEVSSLV